MNSENDLIPADKIPPASLEKAFHLMWDHFPEPVSLIHKSKCVVAVNPACSSIGRTVGSICIKHGKPEAHKGCLALKALKKQTGMYRAGTFEKKSFVVFWLPVDEHPDYYLHFAVGRFYDYEASQE